MLKFIRRGGQEGALAPMAGQKKYVFQLFRKKIVPFYNFFRDKKYVFARPHPHPPAALENFALPWKKSADAHVYPALCFILLITENVCYRLF